MSKTSDSRLDGEPREFLDNFPEKVTPVSADLIILQDSANGYETVHAEVGNLPAGVPSVHDLSGALHNGVAGAVEDNLASFDANGKPKDSGRSTAELEALLAPGEPVGFPNTTDSEFSFSDSTPDRTFTIQPKAPATEFDFYVEGTKYTKNSAQTKQISAVEGIHYLYFDKDTGVLSETTTFSSDLFLKHAIVSIVYWDATNSKHIYLSDERHGIVMDGITHLRLHQIIGAKWIYGLAFNSIDADQSGDLNSHAYVGVDVGSIADEDLLHSISAASSPANIPVYYKTGASGLWRDTTANNFPVKPFSGGSNLLAWNQFTGGSWQQTEITNGRYVLAHIVATNDPNRPLIAIQGQAQYTSQVAARIGANNEINNLVLSGMPFVEFVFLGTIIYQTDTGYGNDIQARIRTTDEGGDYVDFRGFTQASTGSTNDHGNLSGLGDDDHTQYQLKDTNETKSAGLSSNTDDPPDWDEKVKHTFTPIAVGDYEITVSCMMSHSDAGIIMRHRIQVDDTTTLFDGGVALSGKKYSDGAWLPVTMVFTLENLSAASHDIDLDFASEVTAKTCYIKEAEISHRRK